MARLVLLLTELYFEVQNELEDEGALIDVLSRRHDYKIDHVTTIRSFVSYSLSSQL